jgi:hypothetical protein
MQPTLYFNNGVLIGEYDGQGLVRTALTQANQDMKSKL